MKTSEIASTKIVNQEHYHVLWQIQVQYQISQGCNNGGFYHISIKFDSLASSKARRILENYCRLSQYQPRYILIIAIIPGIVWLIEQINIVTDPQYIVLT